MAGPFSTVARDGKFAYTKGGSECDMMAALQCAKLRFEDKSCEIINAYADSLQSFSGPVRNVRMTNSILWADAAHPIFIGLHGNAAGGDIDSWNNRPLDQYRVRCQDRTFRFVIKPMR